MSAARRWVPRRAAAWWVVACVLAGASSWVALGACRAAAADRLPPGMLWGGDARQAARLLVGLEGLRGTPLESAAADLRARLAGCRRFLATCPAGRPCTLAAALRCETSGELTKLADEVRGDAGWVFVQRTPERLLVARGTTQPTGDIVVHATLRAEAGEEPWQALLPARRAPEPGALSDAGALLHLRLRSDRGLAALRKLGAGDWGERLFGLRQQVFLAMDLEGTVELVAFEPAPGELIPPLVAALHVRRPAPAAAAMESLIAGARTQWHAGRRPWRLGAAAGACLDDLNVLPELAPCYLATARALVVGWNRRSVELALRGAPAAAADETSELVVALERFPEADRRLRASYHGSGGSETRYAWSRATLSGSRRHGAYELDLALRGRRAEDPGAAAGEVRR